MQDADLSVQKSGWRLALEGMERAVAHANRAERQWSDRAYHALLRFIQFYDKYELTIEEAKDWAYAKGLPIPPAPGSWGSVTRRAVKAGVLEFLRYQTSRNPSQHSKPVKVWRIK